MKKLLTTIFVFLLFTQVSFATIFYSKSSSAVNTPSNWNDARNGLGTDCASFGTGNTFVIQNTHSMTLAAATAWNISSSGILIIESGGIWTNNSATVLTIGTFTINGGGLYNHNTGTATIPGTTRNFNITNNDGVGHGNVDLQNIGSGSFGTTISWGNLRISRNLASNVGHSGNFSDIKGNLDFAAAGVGEFRFTAAQTNTHTIGGNVTVSSGVLSFKSGTGTVPINIGGNLIINGGTLTATSGLSTVNFTGSGKTFNFSSGTFTTTLMNFDVNSGASLTLVSNLSVSSSRTLTVNGTLDAAALTVSGAGAFTLASGGTLKSTSNTGVNGSVTVSGTKTFSSGANYEFAGTHTGTFTTTPTGSTVNNLTLTHGTSVTLDQALTVAGTLTITTPDFILNTSNLTINGAKSGSGTITGDNAAYLTIGGSGALGTSLSFTSGGRTLAGLTINRTSQTITLGSDLTLDGNLDQTAAGILTLTNGVLDASGVTLSFIMGHTPIVRTSGTLTTNSSTNLVFGTGGNTGGNAFSIPASTFTATPSINNFTVNRTNTLTLGQGLTVNGLLTLTAGTLVTGANTLTIPGTSITRTSGNLDVSSGTIAFTNTGALTLPASLFTGNVNNFTASGTGGVTTSSNITIAGTATIGAGVTMDISTNNFVATGGSSVLAGTGTIQLSGDFTTQIGSYSSNTFQTTGRFWFYGASQVIPAGTYEDLRVQGTGTTLSGDLTVSGDLEMQGTLTVGANTLTISNPISVNPTNLTMDATSSLVINGTAANIHVPSSVTALNNFTYNNSSLVTADANLTISGTFTLGTSGFILDMGANTLEIGTSTANIGAISRIGSGSVRGIIKRWTNTATSSLLFPLNNNATDYVGATVNFSVNPSTGGSLTARYTSSGSGLFPLGPNGIDRYIDFSSQHAGMNLINLSPQFWTISDADGLAGFTYGLTLEANNMGINTSGNNYLYTAIVKRNTGGGNTWAWNNSNHVTTGGNGSNPIPQCQGYTSFSDFAIGGNQDNLLPVELSNFTSAIAGRDLILSWSTGTEINNSGFDIERKSTTGGWSKIGFVAGHGTVNTPNSYTYTDANLTSGKYNYRLKQIDFNGNYKYYNLSNEVIIGTPSKYVLTQNFPNPFNPSTSISYEIPATNFVSLKIYDMMGKEVANLVNATQDAGFYTVKFDASKLASGVYFYKLQANDFTATKKLMLMK